MALLTLAKDNTSLPGFHLAISMTPQALKTLLTQLGVGFDSYQHPPLHTCDDADQLMVDRPGTRLKNLFLRDNYGRRHFLLLTRHDRNLDLKRLTRDLGVSRLGFASGERLNKYLGVNPGSVSLLALINDTERQVELLVDQAIWNGQQFHCHPLINTETLVIDKDHLLKFLEYTGHTPSVISIESN